MLIDLNKNLKKYAVYPLGFIQVGAHLGDEVDYFKKINSNAPIYLFEPQKELFKKLKEKFKKDNSVLVFNTALGDTVEYSTMYKDTNNDSQSSSILQPKDHLKYHSYIKFEKDNKEVIEINTLDSYNISNSNILCIDVQGYELKVLYGSKNLLNKIDALMVEVNRKEMYEGCPHISEIDKFLSDYGFVRVVTKWWKGTIPWGDALYVNKKKISIPKYLLLKIQNYFNQKSYTFFLLSKINILN